MAGTNRMRPWAAGLVALALLLSPSAAVAQTPPLPKPDFSNPPTDDGSATLRPLAPPNVPILVLDSSLRAKNHRYVIFVDGIALTPPTPHDDFDNIQKLVDSALGRDTALFYFSYCKLPTDGSPCSPAWKRSANGLDFRTPIYAADATFTSLRYQAATLEAMTRAITKVDSHADISLIGYSLGGPVTYEWGATYDTGPVHHVLTIDSPVGGISKGVINKLVELGAAFRGPVVGELETHEWLAPPLGKSLLDKQVQVLEVLNRCDPIANGLPLGGACGLQPPTLYGGEVVGRGLQALSPPGLGKVPKDDLFSQGICPVDATARPLQLPSVIDDQPLDLAGQLLLNTTSETVDFILANHGTILGRNGCAAQAANLLSSAIARLVPPKQASPGGVWQQPGDNSAVTAPSLHLAATADPSAKGDPGIRNVNFTVWWPGLGPRSGKWVSACKGAIPAPPSGDRFECDANLADLGAPPGKLTLGFDVMDSAGNVRLSPDGTHTITWSPPPPPIPKPEDELAASLAYMRTLPRLEVEGGGSFIIADGWVRLTLGMPDSFDGEGAVAGASWAMYTDAARSRFTLNGHTYASKGSSGSAAAMRDAILAIPSSVRTWTISREGTMYRLQGVPADGGLRSLSAITGTGMPVPPQASLSLIVDAATGMWQKLELGIGWPLFTTSFAGRAVAIGPASTISLTFGPQPVSPYAAPPGAEDPRDELTPSLAALAADKLAGMDTLGPLAQPVAGALVFLDVRQSLAMMDQEPRYRAELESSSRRYGEQSPQYAAALRHYRLWEYQTPIVGPLLSRVRQPPA